MESNGSQQNVGDTKNALVKHGRRGGWTTFPFILGSIFCLTVASGGWVGNLIVYLITKYNVKSIDATQVNNVVLGGFSLFPIAGAIISDSFYGSFPVIVFFSFVSLVGVTLVTLTSSFPFLRPPPCINMSVPCESPSNLQYEFLYTAIGLASIGIGGTRFTTASLGADQFEDSNDRAIYFNWYFCIFFVAGAISLTSIIYIEDNVSWRLGFGISVACNLFGVILFLSGKNFYRHIKPKGSPSTSIARVIVAALRKRKVSLKNQEYNYGIDDIPPTSPSNDFRFLNHGAVLLEVDGPKSKSWSLCTVQELEDLKTLIRIMPLWSSGIPLSTLIGMLSNFAILQALTMDGHAGGCRFKIPPASFLFFNTLATSISLFTLDRVFFPMWQKLTGRSLTSIQKIGIGHVFNIVAFVTSALIEIQRLHVVRAHYQMVSSMGTTSIVPFSVIWLVVPLIVLGISESFHFPAQISLYYQEFPASMRSTSTAMISLLIAIGFYLSTGITSLIRKNTNWLMDDINKGRLDIVYWMLAVIGVVNFGYFLICAKMFQHKLDIGDSSLADVSSS